MSERLTQLQEFLKENPVDPFLLYAIASEYGKLNQHDKALAAFKSLTITNPDYLGTYYQLGKLYEELQDTEQAIDTYEKGILIAQQQRNRHTLAELQRALQAAKDEEDEDF